MRRLGWVLGPGAVAAGRDIKGPVTIFVVAGVFERLNEAIFDPAPMARKLGLKPDREFAGREWLIRKIDDYIASHRSGYVVIQGEAGVGKSTLAAHLVWSRPCAYHFTELPGGRDPEQARRSLAAQLIGTWQLAPDLAVGDVFPGGADRPAWLLNVLEAAANRRDQSNPGEPLVLVIDGLNEADPPAPGRDTGIPLGLPRPEFLPDRVFIVATCRFGHLIANLYDQVSWQPIIVDGRDNLEDMRQYLTSAVSGEKANETLVRLLAAEGLSGSWFVDTLLQRCAGVWIYLRYVLDSIICERRSVTDLDTLPDALSGYYAAEIQRWQSIGSWPDMGFPALATLAALRRQVTRAELAHFAQVDDSETLRRWLNEQLRPFLDVTHDSGRRRQYYIRHESLRELFQRPGAVPGSDDAGIGDALYAALTEAHDRIVTVLLPLATGRQRDWSGVDSYTRATLPEHAAACGRLDELTAEAGFLLCAEPSALLRWRTGLTTAEGLAALAAYQLSQGQSAGREYSARAWWLHVWARKTRADRLAESAAELSGRDWEIDRAWWSGTGHQNLRCGGWVLAVAVARVDETDVIVFGSTGGEIRIWEPGSGEVRELFSNNGAALAIGVGEAGGSTVIAAGGAVDKMLIWDSGRRNEITKLTDYQGWCPVVVGRFGGRDVVAFGSSSGALRIWDLDTRSYLQAGGRPEEGVSAVAIGMINEQDVIVTGGSQFTIRIWWSDGRSESISLPPSSFRLTLHDNPVSAVAIGRIQGRDLIAAGGKDGTVQIWDPRGQMEPTVLRAHDHDIKAVAFCHVDGRDVIISAGQQEVQGDSTHGSVRLWDLAKDHATPSVLLNLQRDPYELTGASEVHSMAVGRIQGRDVVVCGGQDNMVRLRNLGGPPELEAQWGYHGSVTALAIGAVKGRDVIVSANAGKTLHIVDPTCNAEPVILAGHQDEVYSLAVGQVDGEDVIVSADGGGIVHIWDPTRRADPVVIPTRSGRAKPGWREAWHTSVAIVRVGGVDTIAVADNDGVRLLDREGNTTAFLDSPGEKRLATARLDGLDVIAAVNRRQALLLHAAKAFKLTLASENLHRPDCIAIGQFGGQYILVAAEGDSLRIFNLVNGAELGWLASRHHQVWHTTVTEIAGQEAIVSAGADGALRIWTEGDDSVLLTELVGHTGPIDSMAVGRLGNQNGIVTGYRDGTLLLWRPRQERDQPHRSKVSPSSALHPPTRPNHDVLSCR